MIGVSADGINGTSTFEVKCPSKASTFKNYHDGKGIKPKFRAQMQLQMFLNGKGTGYFCVAQPDFEKSNEVSIYQDTLDLNFLQPLIESAAEFWKDNIFRKII
ncbi:hypothetical protein QAD02_007473 [Eretmocerus hayati]|uniref:Uncharacterized protein n=1 Tax=Eretmocerus hayati TaxID=131215 RepID=A0ACC2N420_9HYME|nr:hypothetical protein QAD02_007473 [Eretmocerus hayati]